MNKEQSLALHARGKDAWNAWAQDMLDKKAELEAAGQWNEAARADFSHHEFEDQVDFSGFLFPGDAGFGGATFSGDAWFVGATFEGVAWFDGAKFKGYAGFDGAKFKGYAGFVGATFEGVAWFDGAKFEGRTVFDHATFDKAADFGAIEAKTAFSLANATFRAVPDFIQAHFEEAPRLDNLSIEPRRLSSPLIPRVKELIKNTIPRVKELIKNIRQDGVSNLLKARFKGDPDLAARWRALKRLAIQGHDHAREQEYFKGELLARRWGEDKWNHLACWFGIAYQVLSDFGGSIVRPALWWLASVFVFAALYLGQHPDFANWRSSRLDWLANWMDRQWAAVSGAVPLPAPPPTLSALSCVAGSSTPGGSPWGDALILSFQKGLLVFGLVPADKVKRIHACLYGVYPDRPCAPQPADLPWRFIPVIPDPVTAFSFLQYPISAILLFLLLLAVRNHFRIK